MSEKFKVLVAFDSKGGNTKLAAEYVAEGVRQNPYVECILARVDEIDPEIFPECKGLIVGSPTYTGGPTSKVKTFLDEGVRLGYPFTNAIGGAFATTLGIGAETTILSIIHAMLINKMVVCGPYGPWGRYGGLVTGGRPKKESDIEMLRMLGRRVADLVYKIYKE
jgi:multimeric flavodoxin WrbA